LNAIRVFEVAARYQILSKAAEELFVTRAAVSRQITLLEDGLGVKLFVRHHRKVELADEVRSLAALLQQSFEQIASAVRICKRNTHQRILKIVLYPTIARVWLISRLARFHVGHPDVEVQITTSMRTVDFVNEDVDFSILFGEMIPKDVESTPIISEVLLPVCSPKLMAGRSMQLEDLSLIPLIPFNSLYKPVKGFGSVAATPRLQPKGIYFETSGGKLLFGISSCN
jgi:LysR family glycine cleavage system transcriptional activator